MLSPGDVLRGSFLALLQAADERGLKHEQLAELCARLEVRPFENDHLRSPGTLSAVVDPEALELPKWFGRPRMTNDARAVVVYVERLAGGTIQCFAFANSKEELSNVVAWATSPRIRHVSASAYLQAHGEWPELLRQP